MKPLRQVSLNKRYVYYFTPANVQLSSKAVVWNKWFKVPDDFFKHKKRKDKRYLPAYGFLTGKKTTLKKIWKEKNIKVSTTGFELVDARSASKHVTLRVLQSNEKIATLTKNAT